MLTYFTNEELACPLTGEMILQDGFGEKLDALRDIYGKPMIVTSCCRSLEHNEAVGGHPRSLHLTNNPYRQCHTCAIDIARHGGDDLARLLTIALTRGWSVGIAKTFIHLDRRMDIGLTQTVYTY